MAPDNNRPFSELVADLTRQLRVLFRQEIALARAEVTAKATSASRSLVFVGAGVALAYAGLLAIVASVCLLLWMLGLNAALAAFLGGAAFALLGYLLLRSGMAGLRPSELAPTTTVETLQDSVETLKGAR